MKQATARFYYILVLCFILPSGNLFNIPIKMLLSVALMFSLIFLRNKILLDKISYLLVFVIVSLFLWAAISLANGYVETALQCIQSFLSMLLIIWLTWILYSNNIIQLKKVFCCFEIVAIGLIGFKFLCELVFLSGIISYDDFLSLFYKIFNTKLTSLHVKLGNISLYRIMITNDVLVLLFWSFYMIMDKKSLNKIILTIVMAFFCLLIFSRVYLVQYVLCLLVVVGISILKANKNRKKKFSTTNVLSIIIGLLGLIVVAILVLNSGIGKEIIDALYNRFFGTDADYSDSFRNEQYKYLMQGFLSSPIWGNGTGSYPVEYIRSEIAKYSYELEYLSFLYQFGILGFLFIIVTILYVVYKICFVSVKNKYIKYIVIFNLAIWAIKPFFNPGFLTSNSGILIAMVCICSKYCQQQIDKRKLINFK